MRHVLIVSTHGRITLPVEIRKQWGLKPGEPIIIEDRNGELVLKPAMVVAIDSYTSEQVEEWDHQDCLDDTKRRTLLKRLIKTRGKKHR